MNARPEPRPGILSIKPYVGGKGGTVSGPVFKLSSNESALGPSPHAREAYLHAAERLAIYPDGAQQDLKAAIAERYGLALDRIMCGAGSDEILSHLGHAYLGPGDEVLYSAHGFVLYPLIGLANGATPVAASETALTADVDALLAAVTERTRIVFLANPNNPTGTYIPVDELKRLQAGLPSQILLVIDSAYAEFVQANDYEAGIELVATCDNVVMTRTFSKIHALAALRLGWAYGPSHVVEAVNRIRGPFNVTSPALAAGAASMRDSAHSAKAIAHNDTWRARLAVELSDLGLGVTPSVANFLLLGFPDMPDKSADRAEAFLAEGGIYLRNVADYGLPNRLRITVGSAEANQAAVKALGEFLGST